MKAEPKVVGRRLRKKSAHKLASRKLGQIKSSGRSSGWRRLHYDVKRGLLHWKVTER